MPLSVEVLQRFGLKLFLRPNVAVDPKSLIPVFHRWIQTEAVSGLLIDVADYTHVANGPKVLLVGHEGNYALDYRNDQPGLYYYRKQPSEGTLGDRLIGLSRILLEASYLLETDDTFKPPIRFRGDQFEFVANDRSLTTSDENMVEALRPVLITLLERLYPSQPYELSHHVNSKDRLTFTLRSTHDVSVETLLNRIS